MFQNEVLKLIDFGSAVSIEFLNGSDIKMMSSLVGTSIYMAPEVI